MESADDGGNPERARELAVDQRRDAHVAAPCGRGAGSAAAGLRPRDARGGGRPADPSRSRGTGSSVWPAIPTPRAGRWPAPSSAAPSRWRPMPPGRSQWWPRPATCPPSGCWPGCGTGWRSTRRWPRRSRGKCPPTAARRGRLDGARPGHRPRPRCARPSPPAATGLLPARRPRRPGRRPRHPGRDWKSPTNAMSCPHRHFDEAFYRASKLGRRGGIIVLGEVAPDSTESLVYTRLVLSIFTGERPTIDGCGASWPGGPSPTGSRAEPPPAGSPGGWAGWVPFPPGSCRDGVPRRPTPGRGASSSSGAASPPSASSPAPTRRPDGTSTKALEPGGDQERRPVRPPGGVPGHGRVQADPG